MTVLDDDDTPCVCGRLRRASRALTRHYDEALGPLGLTITQFSALRTLSRMDRPSLAEMAEATAHEKSALWRTLQPLIRRGWIASERGRALRFVLTEAGRERLAEALPPWRAAQAQVNRVLAQDQAALVALLEKVERHV